MNKNTKGAIAAGAAAALLAGGAGSFALWSDTETVTGGTINSGTLEFVGTTAAGTWYDGATAISDIANYRIVPGKTLTYKASPTIHAEGNNLSAKVTASAGADATGALLPHLTIGTPTVTGTGVGAGGVITPQAATQTVEVSVPVTFKSDVTGTTGQGAQAVLSTITLTLEQTSS
ncbi:alternate-type signal peptide domain-containing protein [Rhodococcus hoagii]|nr:alternate-type signal peptide domain-containing protein [Prescottella equi]